MAKVDLGPIFITSELLVYDMFSVSGSVNTAGYTTNVSVGKTGYILIDVEVYPSYSTNNGAIFVDASLNNDTLTLNVTTQSTTNIQFECDIRCSYLQDVK